jgi:hypothetical protein
MRRFARSFGTWPFRLGRDGIVAEEFACRYDDLQARLRLVADVILDVIRRCAGARDGLVPFCVPVSLAGLAVGLARFPQCGLCATPS